MTKTKNASKLLSVLLALCLTIGMTGLSAFAAESNPDTGAYYDGVRYGTVAEAIEAGRDSDVIHVQVIGSVRWDLRENSDDDLLDGVWDGQQVVVLGVEDAVVRFQSNRLSVGGNHFQLQLHGNLRFGSVTLNMADYNCSNFFANGYELQTDADVATSGNHLKIYGGAENADVAQTSLKLYGGTFTRVFGGGKNGDVTGNASVVFGGVTLTLFGGGYFGDVQGNTSVVYTGAAGGNAMAPGLISGDVYGGCYAGTVAGSSFVSVEGSARCTGGVYGGGAFGGVLGNTRVIIGKDANVDQAFGGGSNSNAAAFNDGGWGDALAPEFQKPAVDRAAMRVYGDTYVQSDGTVSCICGGGNYSDVGKDAVVDARGTVNQVFGGGMNADVDNDTHVTVRGDVEYKMISGVYVDGAVYGGGLFGNIGGGTNVLLTEGSSAYTVLGGCDNACVTGSSTVIVNGRIKRLPALDGISLNNFKRGTIDRELRYSGCVFGASYINALIDGLGSVEGGSTVVIGPAAQIDDSVYGGGLYSNCGSTDVTVSGRVDGAVYGGCWLPDADGAGLLGVVNGDTSVTVTNGANVPAVYGGGDAGNVTGSTSVVLEKGSRAGNAYGASRNETSLNAKLALDETEAFAVAGTSVGGTATVTLLDSSSVAGAVYGYEPFEAEAGLVRNCTGAATVLFDGNRSSLQQIVNADRVLLTNTSDVTIDHEGIDYDQLINVGDLSVDSASGLFLKANAHILGDYTGATDGASASLRIAAGKKLLADGAASGSTRLEIDETLSSALLHQVYIVAAGGSSSGSFQYADAANRFTLEQNSSVLAAENENLTAGELDSQNVTLGDSADKWWLVKTPAYYTVTIHYLDLDTGAEIAAPHVVAAALEGTTYDANPYRLDSIGDYDYDHSSGDTLSGMLNQNKVINLYYSLGEIIEDPDVPLTGPSTPDEEEIPDPDTPLTSPNTGAVSIAWTFGLILAAGAAVSITVLAAKRRHSEDR